MRPTPAEAMQPAIAAGGKAVPPDSGCERPKPHRVPGASSAVAQQARGDVSDQIVKPKFGD